MAFYPTIKDLQESDKNPEQNLYQYIATLTDQSKHRLFLKKDEAGEWVLMGANRLLNIPCPICRKDYYCKCINDYMPQLEDEFKKNVAQLAEK
jgi:hypothetical protein